MHYILFVALENFYSTTLEKADSSLSDRPLIVHHEKVVIDSNLTAKNKGVETGMHLSEAKTLVHGGAFVKWEEEPFREAQNDWLDLCTDFSDVIEPSLQHSAFLDLSKHPEPISILFSLERTIKEKLGWRCQLGLASTKWIAEVAQKASSEAEKPIPYMLACDNPQLFLSSFPPEMLLTIAPEHRKRLRFLGYRTIGEITEIPLRVLREQFGEEGLLISKACRGGIYQKVKADFPKECLVTRLKFDGPVENLESLDEGLKNFAAQISALLIERDRQGSELIVTIDHEDDREEISRKFIKPLQSKKSLLSALKLMCAGQTQPICQLRVRMANLNPTDRTQRELNGSYSSQERSASTIAAFNHIRTVFGDHAIEVAGQKKEPRRKQLLNFGKMQLVGLNRIAHWREAGEWWSGEDYREVVRFLDTNGIRKEEERILPSFSHARQSSLLDPYSEDQSEEWSLKKYKVRDEKVANAPGSFESYRANVKEHKKTYHTPSLIQATAKINYAPLHVISGYAFGRGCMLADEIPILAAHAGITAAALVDPFSLIGAVEFSRSSKKNGVKPLIGCSIELAQGGEVVLIAKNQNGYRNLSRLISCCHLEEPRQFPLCNWDRLASFREDLICLTGGDRGTLNHLLIRRNYKEAKTFLQRLIDLYGRENTFVEIERSYLPWEISVNELLLQLSEKLSVKAVAGGIVTHARRDHFPVQDILVCAESLCVVDEILGRKPTRHPFQEQIPPRPERALNPERFLHTTAEMSALFADKPELLYNTLLVAEQCEKDVLPHRTVLPKLYDNENQVLREFTLAGSYLKHSSITPKLKNRLKTELNRIIRLGFARHFLVAYEMCRWADEQGIQFSGRGSVVDSAVAYCLGLSRIDAQAHSLHFDRFLPEDGSKRPDIDIDFEARHRDKVRNHLTSKYGQKHVATVAAVGTYCTRGIIREVGKALGLPNELIGFLAKRIHGGVSPHHLEEALEKRPELRGSSIPRERFQWVFRLAERLMDIPRNMRAHSSGVVISSQPLDETVPVMWSASAGLEDSESQENCLRIIQWDKRSAKHYFDKFDVLCLRGQDVLSGTQRRVRNKDLDFRVQNLPMDDEETYRAMRSGELIGIPQSASPAMRQAHIRLRTENLHDASLVQAGIRPGVGGAVKLNELIARRRGTVKYSFSHPELERILGITYGITVFQEQVDQLLQAFCNFSSGEAEDTREAIHLRRKEDYGKLIKEQLIERMMSKGHSLVIAEEVFELIAGFKGYGFAQGHALAFAEISIRSIYCQQNYPAEYFAAILSAQPAGYYGPCTLVNEARTRGVAILPPDVNKSDLEFSVEDIKSPMDPKITFPSGAIRVGINQVAGISDQTKKRVVTPYSDQNLSSSDPYCPSHPEPSPVTGDTPAIRFSSFFDFVATVRPSRDELEHLILCGALDSLHPNRRALLWAIPNAQKFSDASLESGGLPLEIPEPDLINSFEDFSREEKALYERMYLDLDVTQHLMCFERARVKKRGCITSAEAKHLTHGRKATVVGNPIRLRFPPTPSGKRVVFFDLEDETGLLNVTCFDSVYQLDGHAIVCSPYVTIIGEAQDRDGHTAFLAHRVFPYRPVIAKHRGAEETLPVTRADFLTA